MKRIVQIFLHLTLLAGLTACGTIPADSAQTPIPEVLYLQVTPAVEHWLPRVAACAEEIPHFGVHTQVLTRAELSLNESDLILRLGERLASDPFVSIMGFENIAIVAGKDVPVPSLSLASLQDIYAGTKVFWGDVPEAADDPSAHSQSIQPMAYPEGHEIEALFRHAFLAEEPIAADPQVYSSVDFLENLLEEHPYALGFLLNSQVPAGIKTLDITDQDPQSTGGFVLAITSAPPEGQLKQLLLCLQNSQ